MGAERSFVEQEEDLLAAARDATGLDDFGPEPFREGLRVLLSAYDAEARFTESGRRMATGDVVGVLVARLLSEAGWKAHPDCRELAIERPLFVLGLPRTGTTALHGLLANDPACQVLELWIASAPGPRPPRASWPGDPRFRAAADGVRGLYALAPGLAALHPMTADGPEECRLLLRQCFLDDSFDSNATIPGYTRWFAGRDLRPAYARHRDLLRLIGSSTPERRWVLKYPAHLRSLDVLLETYPDAVFVWTHRDPARVLPSICSLVSGFRRVYEDDVDDVAIGRWQLDMWASIVERGMALRRRLAPERFFDLPLRELQQDPLRAVRGVYAHFGFELSGEAERAMAAWREANPPGRHGAHAPEPERFGLDEAEVAERFAGYREAFGVEREPPAGAGWRRAPRRLV